jgi:hypothetical protein
VTSIHHRQIESLIPDLLRDETQLGVWHFDEILRIAAKHRGSSWTLTHAGFRTTVLLGGSLWTGVTHCYRSSPERSNHLPPGHGRLRMFINPIVSLIGGLIIR